MKLFLLKENQPNETTSRSEADDIIYESFGQSILMCLSTVTAQRNSSKKKLMAFPGVVKPWHAHSPGQFHPFACSPWNTPPNPATASPLTNGTTANAHILYQQPQSQSAPQASPIKTSPVSLTPPSLSSPVPNFPARTVPESPQPPLASNTQSDPFNFFTSSNLHNPAVLPIGHPTRGSTSPSPAKKPKRVRRKRCLMCEGCLRKDNCGTCSVCTNSNATNTVCKMRRCDVLKRRPSVVS